MAQGVGCSGHHGQCPGELSRIITRQWATAPEADYEDPYRFDNPSFEL
jgi:hypothetical protein